MKVLYRISDGGNIKNKPAFVHDKKQMFMHFINTFKEHDIYVFADNVSNETYNFLISCYNPTKINRISLGNSKSFMFTLKYATEHFADNEKIYFAEDDYIYTKNAASIIEEGLDISDYSSGYDHPDKYINHSEGGPNPFISGGGENTKVITSKNTHWKITNSCCMTFAASSVKLLKEDYDIFQSCCMGNIPNDFQLWCMLYKYKHRKLISCIPAVSTHGETEHLSKFIDWEKEFNLCVLEFIS